MSSIKINRAKSLSLIGNNPGSFGAMLDRVPATTVATVPAAALAQTIDAMWGACQESKRIAMADAIATGAVWDERRGQFREIT